MHPARGFLFYISNGNAKLETMEVKWGYEINLRKYLRENPEKTERDYLKEQLGRLEGYLKEEKEDHKIKKWKNHILEYELILSRLPKGINEEPRQNTLNGKKLNLSERYVIAKEVFNIDKQISTLNISEAEKDKLLSLILDCNTTNARHIMNGKYPGKIRKELITEYIQTLKK